MTNVLSTVQALDNYKVSLGNWIGVCTGPPGASTTVLNEAAYTQGGRKQTTWTSGSNGSNTGSLITLYLPAGTYPYLIICAGSSGNNMVDWSVLNTPIVVGLAGPVTLTPTSTTS